MNDRYYQEAQDEVEQGVSAIVGFVRDWMGNLVTPAIDQESVLDLVRVQARALIDVPGVSGNDLELDEYQRVYEMAAGKNPEYVLSWVQLKVIQAYQLAQGK